MTIIMIPKQVYVKFVQAKCTDDSFILDKSFADSPAARLVQLRPGLIMEGEKNLPFGSWRDGGNGKRKEEGSKPEVSLVLAAGL